jgi:hypothetical protein
MWRHPVQYNAGGQQMFVSFLFLSLIKPIITLPAIVLLHELCEYFKE